MLIALLVLAALAAFELYRSNSSIDIEQIEVQPDGLPDGFDGFRIAHVSDLHMNSFGVDNDQLCATIAQQEVDIIVITGDYVNDKSDVDRVYATAANLAATAPTYFVPGNHDYSGRYPDIEEELVRAGVTVLRNRAVELERGGDRITLLGIDDPNGYRDMLPMDSTVALARQRNPDLIVMLNHRYDRADEAAALGVQVMLAGHAHGGLIRLPFTDGIIGPGRVLFPRNTNGLYRVGDMDLVTSRGLGNAKPTLRMFNRFHLPIITFSSR